MKCLIFLSFLLSVVVPTASIGAVAAASPAKPALAACVSLNSTPKPQRDVFYFSDRFGFRFVSPSGYVIVPAEVPPAPQPPPAAQVLELWQQADYLNRENLPESPPLIHISVYPNTRRLPLTRFKGELSRNDDRPLTLAGQPAIAYTSTGLYESDNVVLSSPDRRYVLRLTVGYIDARAPMRQTFCDVLSSLTFDVRPASNSKTQWRIDYSRLQRLLAAQHWQAADLETRAILQRLAGAKGDLLFSSKSVVPRLPLADLRILDQLWSNASGGRFGFSAQARIWREVAQGAKNSQVQAERFAQRVGWRRSQPLPPDHPLGIELQGSVWRLETELNYTTAAPIGHFPWVGVSSSRLIEMLDQRSLGCGSCTIDARYLVGDRYRDYLPALLARF